MPELVRADAPIQCDLAVVGIGVTPATGWLDGSGLELNNGLVCDETLATNVPFVYHAYEIVPGPSAKTLNAAELLGATVTLLSGNVITGGLVVVSAWVMGSRPGTAGGGRGCGAAR